MTKFTLVMLAIITILCSCEEITENNSNLIVPIEEGNSWTYSNYNHIDQTTDTANLVIGKYRSIKGNSGFDIGGSLIKNDEDGNYVQVCMFVENDTIISNEILFQSNAKTGDVYNVKEIVRIFNYNDSGEFSLEEQQTTRTCITQDTVISTPAGEFNCIVFRDQPDDYGIELIYYIALNIGYVKGECIEDGILYSTSELIEYNIK